MKKSIVIIIFSFHIFFALGMKEKYVGVNSAHEKKTRSIFEEEPSFSEYEHIFKKKAAKVEKSQDFRPLENLVRDMEEGKLSVLENYIKKNHRNIRHYYIYITALR